MDPQPIILHLWEDPEGPPTHVLLESEEEVAWQPQVAGSEIPKSRIRAISKGFIPQQFYNPGYGYKEAQLITDKAVFVGDLTPAAMKEAAVYLDETYNTLGSILEIGTPPSPRVNIYIYRSRLILDQVVLSTLGGFSVESATRFLAFYSPRENSVFVWLQNENNFRHSLVHEYVHVFLQSVVNTYKGRLDVWLDEGMAEWVSNYEWHKRIVPGAVSDQLAGMIGTGWLALSDLLFMTHDKFYEMGMMAYAHAWSFVHMLMAYYPAWIWDIISGSQMSGVLLDLEDLWQRYMLNLMRQR